MEQVSFFIRYALSNMDRNRQRTIFVLFCIAVGVAAVVSLRTLGMMIGDSLASNLQAANRGDMVIRIDEDNVTDDDPLFDVEGSEELQFATFSKEGIARIDQWAGDNDCEIMPIYTNNGPYMRVYTPNAAGFTMVRFVEPDRYPFYREVTFSDPEDAMLSEVLDDPHSVAVDEKLADELGLQVGDEVQLVGAPDPFTVTAIVDPRSETSMIDVLTTVYTFLYVPYQTGLDVFEQMPNVFYVKMPEGTDVEAVARQFRDDFPGTLTTTTGDLRRFNETFSRTLTQAVTVMGLASLLIGGVGIANTMVVVVRRRNLEIAVLKTIGVQGNQIVLLFIAESLIMGLIGSVVGVALGLGLVFALRGVGEQFVTQSLAFAVYPEALGMGLILGVVVTLVFGFLPTFSAGLVRPNRVLRPDDEPVPQAGRLTIVVVLVGLTAVMGIAVGQILDNLLIGMGIAYATIIILGVIGLVLWLVVWAISRLPSFGSVPVKIAQRSMDGQKGRVASTLLALVAGIFTLNLVAMAAQGLVNLVSTTTEDAIGGNVLVAIYSLEAGEELEEMIAALPSVTKFEHDTVYVAEVVAINGDRDVDALVEAARERAGMDEAGGAAAVILGEGGIGEFITEFDMKVLEDDTWPYTIVEGEDIVGENEDRILLEPSVYDSMEAWFDLHPGDTITLQFPGGEERTATVMGITNQHDSGFTALSNFRENRAIVLPGFVPEGEIPVPSFYVLTIPEEEMDNTLTAVSEVRGTFIVTTDQFTVFMDRFAEQFASLPLIVAGLALFASSVIIANMVSLATLERRRQIGIMKALGLQAEQVLGLLLLENGLVGLVGGIIGVGVGAIVAVVSGLLGESSNLPYGVLAGSIGLAVVLSLGATMVTAYGASREKPLIVLRYE